MTRSRINDKGELFFADGIEFIKSSEFEEREDIRKVYLSSSIKEIGMKAFFKCPNLEEIIFPSGTLCERIGREAFFGCKKLKEINFPYSLKVVEDYAFTSCVLVPELIFRSKVSFIGRYAFAYCPKIKKISVPQECTIMRGAFKYTCNVDTFSIGRKEYRCVNNFFSFAVVLKEIPRDDILILKTVVFDTYTPTDGILGTNSYHCIGSQGSLGEGETEEEAIKDYRFLSTRNQRYDEIKDLKIDSGITMEQYRLIAGSCNMGMKEICARTGLDKVKYITVRELMDILKQHLPNDVTTRRFFNFFENDGTKGLLIRNNQNFQKDDKEKD